MADEKAKQHLVPIPEHYQKRPFVLIWAEKTAVEKLKSGKLAFSESTGGVTAEHFGEPESVEATGQAVDTTITF